MCDLKGGKECDILIKKDEEVKDVYRLATFLPKTKTARNAMDKDALYLICTMFDIHPPKLTKKAMLELICEKLKE
jgi:hypothetical protein